MFKHFLNCLLQESSTGSPINQTEATDQHSEQSSNILNGNKSPDSLVENFQELPASKLTAKQTEADTPNSFRPITTAEELFSTTPSESNVIKLLDSESTDPGSEVSKSVDDQKDESEDAADIITVSSKTSSLKKAAKGGKAMTLKLKRIDNDLLEKHEKTVKSSSKANSVINGESEDTTSHELQTFSLNTSGNATTSDDELNLALVKKKQEQSTRSEHVTTESSKSAKSTAETSAKSEANIAASESEQSSSESSEVRLMLRYFKSNRAVYLNTEGIERHDFSINHAKILKACESFVYKKRKVSSIKRASVEHFKEPFALRVFGSVVLSFRF